MQNGGIPLALKRCLQTMVRFPAKRSALHFPSYATAFMICIALGTSTKLCSIKTHFSKAFIKVFAERKKYSHINWQHNKYTCRHWSKWHLRMWASICTASWWRIPQVKWSCQNGSYMERRCETGFKAGPLLMFAGTKLAVKQAFEQPSGHSLHYQFKLSVCSSMRLENRRVHMQWDRLAEKNSVI